MNDMATDKPTALETRSEGVDGRRFSPSIARNKDPIREVFLAHMARSGDILEIASGTGEHGVHIVSAVPDLIWHYSDIDGPSLASQQAWVAHSGLPGLQAPVQLDARTPHWGDVIEAVDFAGMVAINMIHIAPMEAAAGLMAGAGRRLKPDGRLFLYGPFARKGEIAASNAAFSESLKARDPGWGVRDLEMEIVPLAAAHGLHLVHVETMPANNLSAIFARA